MASLTLAHLCMAINPALRVDLAPAFSSSAVLEEEIVVTITEDGAVYIGSEKVEREGFPQMLKKAMVRTGKKTMLLLGDGDVPYRTMVDIMDSARITGIETISLGTSKLSVPERQLK